MLDFTLIENGEEFEQLCEDILRNKGIEIITKPSRGPDFGVDIIATITVTDNIGISEKHRILIECKHFAKSNRSVRENDIGNIIERTIANNCHKYLLITSTTVSSVVSYQLQGITNNPSIPFSATFWAKNDLDKIINEYPDIRDRYFIKKQKENIVTIQKTEPELTVIVHSHPDFSQELNKIVNLWNEQQKHISFNLIRPSRLLETKLLSSGSISEDETATIADKIREEAGFLKDDGIIQFCEKRLYGGQYYQLFASGTEYYEEPPNTSTISLQFMRLLSQGRTPNDSSILDMIYQSIIHVISTGIGLEAHDETRGCIMDFDNNMSDILVGLKDGPKYCTSCEKQIKKMGATKIEFVVNDLGVSRLTAANYLNKLSDDNMLRKNKLGTGNYYINEELFEILTKR